MASDSLDEASDDEQSQAGKMSKGSRSKRRRQAKSSGFVEDVTQVRMIQKGKGRKWEKRSDKRVEKWKERQAKQSNVRGVSHNGQKSQGYYAKLRKSLYGLRRAAKLFNRGLRELLQANGYESCPADACIFRKFSGTESILFNTHVDDFACYPTCDEMFDELCAVLRAYKI